MPARLTASQFQTFAAILPELEWFANLANPNTRRAYRQDIQDFIPLRACSARNTLANDTIRRKLAALSSLYAYLCERHAVLHNPVVGVKRPRRRML